MTGMQQPGLGQQPGGGAARSMDRTSSQPLQGAGGAGLQAGRNLTVCSRCTLVPVHTRRILHHGLALHLFPF
jgi:hypothetical protein